MTRVAAVDLGTNSTRLLLAHVHGGEVEPELRLTTVTRLGAGVDASRRLSDEGIARVHEALRIYKRAIDDFGAVRTCAVGTSAIRDAANGEELMSDIAERYGFETRIVTGDEEAQLTLSGVGALDPTTVVLDVGGGSTELITASFRTSLDVGSVRVTERYLHSDPPAAEELDAAAAFVRDQLPPLSPRAAIGVAGTVAQLHALAGELTAEAVAEQLDRLASLPLEERRELPGMEPARAHVIVGGALIVREVLRRYELPRIAFSERDILDGIAREESCARKRSDL